jgi:protein-S-isoprenylcysteine O-methyltransferase Ste14
MLRIGPLLLTGPAATAATIVLFAGIVTALARYRARILSSPLSICAALWLGFMIYWSVAARHTAPTKSRESHASRRLHELLLNGALLLIFVPVPGFERRILPSGWWVVVVGLAIQAASMLLAVSARRHLGRNWSAEISKKADHELVRSGPYGLVRHPIYTAILGMFLGMATVSGDLHAFVGVVLVAIAYARKIRLEEKNLREVFGASYDDYVRSTRALVPWVF